MVDDAITEGSPLLSIEELSGSTLLAGSVWVIASSALPQIYVLSSSILVARFLSVDDMGVQSFIAFVSASLMMICSFGLSGSLVRYGGELVGQDRLGALRGLVWWTARIQLFGALLTGVVLVVIGLFSPDLQALWMWAAVGTAIGTMQSVPVAVLSVLRRWRETSIITLVIGLAYTIGIAGVLIAGGGLTGVFALGAVVGAVAFVWTTILALRFLNAVAPQSEAVPELHRPLLGYAATIWAGFLLTFVVLRRSEFFFLNHYSSAKAIAYYSVAFAVVAGLGSGVESLGGVVAPTVAALKGAGSTERIGPAFSRAMRIVIMVSVPLSAFGIVFGPALIRLIYGDDYANTGAPLKIMLGAFPVIALMSLCAGLLWGIGRVRVWLLVFCVAAVVDVSLDFLLIPAHAEVGAALANIGAQVTAAVLIIGYTVRLFAPIEWQARVLTRAVVAAVIAAGAGWMVLGIVDGAAGIVAGMLSTLVAFCLLSRWMRTVPATDAAWISAAVRGRVGGWIAWIVGRASVDTGDELVGL